MSSPTRTPHLSPAALARGDPALRALTRSGVSPVSVGIAVALLFTVFRFGAAWRAGNLFDTANPVGFFRDPAMYAHVVIGAVLVGYWAWLPRGISGMFDAVAANDVASTGPFRGGPDGQPYATFAARMAASPAWSWVPPVAFALGVVVVGFLIVPGYWERMARADAWSMADAWSLGLSAGWAFLGLYALAVVVAYYALTVVWLRRLFRESEVRVRPLHPDGAGGLGPLGALSIRVSYLLTVVGLLLVVTAITRDLYLDRLQRGPVQVNVDWNVTRDLAVALGFYAIGSPLLFFALPAVAHDPMRTAKDRLLLEISESFEGEYVRLKDGLAGGMVSLKDGIERLDQLRTLYDTTRRFPVWPFNVENLRRFGATWISPIALAVATSLALKLVGE